MDIRYGQEIDFEWLRENDREVAAAWISRCLHHGEYILAVERQERRGFLRFSRFWGSIPFMDLIWVLKHCRREGVGTALFVFWEQEMRRSGLKLLMTSSVRDEPEPQRWHKRNGFRECGQLTLGQHQPTPEVFFLKDVD